MSEELYRRCRPTKLTEIVGQEEAVGILLKAFRDGQTPHALLLCGPSGSGKTTAARCLKGMLDVSDTDFREMNCADVRGIDNVRDMISEVSMMPFGGSARMWVIDEGHKLTNDAQNALLKLLEDTPRHAYFVLCTTEPEKLIATVRSRCAKVEFKAIADQDMHRILCNALDESKLATVPGLCDAIVLSAEGNAREAINLLENALRLETKERMLEYVGATSAKSAPIELCRLLAKGATWPAVAACVKSLTEDPEKVRRVVLGYFSAVLLGGKQPDFMVAKVIKHFSENYYDTGKAGLVFSCFNAIHAK